MLPVEEAPGFRDLGLEAFTTTRAAGSFNLSSQEAAADVFGRHMRLASELAPRAPRFATAHQVHGDRVLVHRTGWSGWLRFVEGADGHATFHGGIAMAVSLADCVPIFLAHPSGAAALLHSGWKGTERRIVERAIAVLVAEGNPASELVMHLGPAICGKCYEVGPDVYTRLTGRTADKPAPVDLRDLIAAHASRAGVRSISTSRWCTRCHNERFFSHRAGDHGRQLAVMVVPFAG